MTSVELHKILEAGVNDVDFEPPVSVAYCQAVYKAIRARHPGCTWVEVYHLDTEVVIAAWDSGAKAMLRLPCV